MIRRGCIKPEAGIGEVRITFWINKRTAKRINKQQDKGNRTKNRQPVAAKTPPSQLSEG
jgi:hypothetical protein